MKSLETRKKEALELRQQGYNCAQSVLMVFDDIIPLDRASLIKLSSGLGAGVGAGELCGVANGMAMGQGFIFPAEAAAKVASMKSAKSLLDEFAKLTSGKLRCIEIKGAENPVPCNDLILYGIELLHKFYAEKQ